MKRSIFYLDESGNSGDILKNNFIETNNDHKIFSQSCIHGDIQQISHIVSRSISDFRIQSPELKSKKLLHNKDKRIIENLVDSIIENNFSFYIELVEKKFSICANIVAYFIFSPHFEDAGTEGLRNLYSRKLTGMLCSEISDQMLNTFSSIPDNLSNDQDIDEIFAYLKQFFTIHKVNNLDIPDMITDCYDIYHGIFKKKFGVETAKKKFFPLADPGNKKPYKSLLHCTCIPNIIGRIRNDGFTKILLVHDKQIEFETAIRKIVSDLCNMNITQTTYDQRNGVNFNISNVKIAFLDSKRHPGIQLSDILSGVARHVAESIIEDQHVDATLVRCFIKMHRHINYVISPNALKRLNLYFRTH